MLFNIREEGDIDQHPVGNHDERFHAALQHHFQIAFEAAVIVLRIRKNRKIRGFVEAAFNATQDRSAERVGDIDYHHADRMTAAAA